MLKELIEVVFFWTGITWAKQNVAVKIYFLELIIINDKNSVNSIA